MQRNAKLWHTALLVLVCVASMKLAVAMELEEEQAKTSNASETVDMEEKALPVTEYGKDMVTRTNPGDRDNGLKQLWEKVPASARPAQPINAQPAAEKNMRGIK